MLYRVTVVLICAIYLVAGPTAADDGPLFPIEENKKWGFINIVGQVVISPQYDNCYYPFSEGLAAVKVRSKWGYINRNNRVVIPPRFDGARPFRGGIAAVHVGEPFVGRGAWGYIDKTGAYVLPRDAKYSYTGFVEGRMSVQVDGKWGYVDEEGRQVIPPVFDLASTFSEGLARVRQGDQHGFIDTAGRWAIRLKDAVPAFVCEFGSGLAPVFDRRSGEYGYIDKTGAFAIEPQFDNANCFSEDHAGVCIAEEDETGWPVRKWGYIDPSGKTIVPAKYEAKFGAFRFREGMAKVCLDGKSGFVNLNGEEVIPCRFAGARSFQHGLARVTVGGFSSETGWWGYIDKTGKFVWRPSDFADRDKARLAEEQRGPSVRLFSDPKSKEEGLLVRCPQKVHATGEKAGDAWITVTNRLAEEIFLEVTPFELHGYELESKDGGYYAGGGGSSVGVPNNERLLKRLHASTYSKGRRFTRDRCSTRLKARVDFDALKMAPARGTVTVRISGYYRNTGREFSESIDVPIEIVAPAEPNSSSETRPE